MAAAWAALVGATVQLQPSAAHRATLLVGTGWLVLVVSGALAVVGGRCSSFGRTFRRQPPHKTQKTPHTKLKKIQVPNVLPKQLRGEK
jgi:hypothetical protein